METIVERIFRTMEEENIRQIDIANKLEIGQSTIANWKKRNCPPPINYIDKIANLLGVSIDYLVTGTDEPIKYKLDNDERYLIRLYRTASNEDKELIQSLAIKLADENYYEKTDSRILLKTLIDTK